MTEDGTDDAGRTHADVMRMTDDGLERHHDYIQWLFPLPEPSRAVPASPILTPEDLAILRASDRAQERMRAAAERMMQFYGATRFWLAEHNHNHLRISRIIRSLRLIVGDAAADDFRASVLARATEAKAPISATTLGHWHSA